MGDRPHRYDCRWATLESVPHHAMDRQSNQSHLGTEIGALGFVVDKCRVRFSLNRWPSSGAEVALMQECLPHMRGSPAFQTSSSNS